MKTMGSILIFCLLPISISAQTPLDSLLQKGIEYHDQGLYQKAIETYQKALAIDSASALLHYEIAYSYFSSGDYENTIKHSDMVLTQDGEYMLQAYLTKSSALDYMGKTQESISLLEKAVEDYGDYYLLHYNLAFSCYNLGEYEKAQEALINAILAKPDHSSSHLLLAYVMLDQKQRVPALLCFHYFLFLESDSERAKAAYGSLLSEFQGNVTKDEEDPNQINIILSPLDENNEFSAAEMMIPLMQAANMSEENVNKSEEGLFIENTTSFFMVLGELKKKKSEGIWWNYYVPFFYELAQSDYIDTYCYYISQSGKDESLEWLQNNTEKLEAFDGWLKGR